MFRHAHLLAVAATLLAAPLSAETPTPRTLPPSGAATLGAEKQQRIWDHEHTAFLIEAHFGKAFNKALVAGDDEKLRSMLAESFTGAVSTAEGTVRKSSLVTEIRARVDPDSSAEVDAEGFLGHLRAEVARLESVRRTAFKVLFIEAEPEKPGAWSATIRIEMGGLAKGEAPAEFINEYEAEFVFDDEEMLKRGAGVLTRAATLSEVQRESERLLMEEVSEAAGLLDLPLPDNWTVPVSWVRGHRYQIAVEDYDRDGWHDIAIGTTDGRPFLLRSIEGRRFENVAASVGLKPTALSPKHLEIHALVGWIDIDNDGWTDLLMGGRLYRNEDGKRFADVTAASGLKFDRVPFGITVADYDSDGLLDIYVSYQKGFERRPAGKRPWVGDPYAGAENHLWRNLGEGKFANVTDESGAAGGRHQTFAAAAFFYDDDHHPDLYLANDFGTNVLLRNRGDGSFEDVTAASGTGDYSTSMGVVAGDLDNDGTSELFIANMYSKQGRRVVAHISADDYPPGIHEMIVGSLAGNRLYRKTASGRYEELSRDLGVNAVGWAHAPAMVDLNADGWLDLYATAGYNSVDRSKPDG